jgi:hypothetical protein
MAARGYEPLSAPVPGTAAVRRGPAIGAADVRFPAVSAASPSVADMAAGSLEGSTWTQSRRGTRGPKLRRSPRTVFAGLVCPAA